MHPNHTTFRDLIGNASIEAIELTEAREAGGTAGFADPTPDDADAFAGDELTEREIDALYVAEMERRDREAATGDDTDPTPPAGARAPLPPETDEYWRDVAAPWDDEQLIEAVSLASDEPRRVNLNTHAERDACLSAFTGELLRRLAA
jgi:hypothetical protein